MLNRLSKSSDTLSPSEQNLAPSRCPGVSCQVIARKTKYSKQSATPDFGRGWSKNQVDEKYLEQNPQGDVSRMKVDAALPATVASLCQGGTSSFSSRL